MAAAQIQRRMRETLPSGVLALIDLVAAESDAAYLVGGLVRDLLLGLPGSDLDITVEGDAISLAIRLHERFGGKIDAYPQFGTATWQLDQQFAQKLGLTEKDTQAYAVDFVTTRRESYKQPGALPTTTPSTLADDLRRRDFTLNTLAVRIMPGLSVTITNTLIDLFEGAADLSHGILRVLHDQSFEDDPTRVFRGVRFEQRFGFRFDPHTRALIDPALPVIDAVSGERITFELQRIFREKHPANSLLRLEELGVLRQIDPDLHADSSTSAALRALRWLWNNYTEALSASLYEKAAFLVFFCRVSDGARLIERLKLYDLLPRLIAVQRARQLLISRVDADKSITPSQFVQGVEPLDMPSQAALWAIMPYAAQRALIWQYMQHWQFIKPELTGDDLKRMGLRPGPLFGKLLRQLRNDLLDGHITHAQEVERVQSWIAQGIETE